jgi:hypothetical protein
MDFVAGMSTFFQVVPIGGGHCDFCSASPVFKLYAGGNFQWLGREIFASGSDGIWAACQKCADW